jgi:ABC-2 type transport system permease protein
MTVWQTIRLVMSRELTARKRAFAISTTLVVVIAVGAIALASLGIEANGASQVTAEEADEGIGFASVIVLFIGIIMTGQVIMEGVAEEKRSRVVEVVLGTMLPRHLLAGKIAAIGLMGLTEIALLCAAAAATGQALDVFQIPLGTALGLASIVLWFVLGFALYSAVYGAAGAMVAPHENVSNGAIPINLGLAIPYFVAISTAPQGDNLLLQVLSIFPLSAPLTMPLRTVRGFTAPWEVALALALTVGAIYVLIRLAGRLYTGAVMRGGKVRWREAWRTAAHVE